LKQADAEIPEKLQLNKVGEWRAIREKREEEDNKEKAMKPTRDGGGRRRELKKTTCFIP